MTPESLTETQVVGWRTQRRTWLEAAPMPLLSFGVGTRSPEQQSARGGRHGVSQSSSA
jgi:hypothetical protein